MDPGLWQMAKGHAPGMHGLTGSPLSRAVHSPGEDMHAVSSEHARTCDMALCLHKGVLSYLLSLRTVANHPAKGGLC